MDRDDKKKVKILQVTIGDGNYGGVASFMYSYYSHMDHQKIHCDFLYCGENSMKSKADSIVLRDSVITTLHIIKHKDNGLKEYKELVRELKEFFKKNTYDIVHANTSNVLVSACVAYALRGKSVYIAHSHNTKAIIKQCKFKDSIKTIIKIPARRFLLKKADYYFACSKAAGENLFGSAALKSEKFHCINNAIDLSLYTFDQSIREIYRKSDKTVIGYVGRFTEQKNPFFLIDVFSKLHELNSNTELWMIGEGELMDEIKSKISSLGLSDSITLWGRRNDVSGLMQAMDIFMLPSLYEGLSIVAVEAQAAGLPVYASDSISEEHKVTDLVSFLPLDLGAEAWAKKIACDIKNLSKRRNMRQELADAGYEIDKASKWLEEFYIFEMSKK